MGFRTTFELIDMKITGKMLEFEQGTFSSDKILMILCMRNVCLGFHFSWRRLNGEKGSSKVVFTSCFHSVRQFKSIITFPSSSDENGKFRDFFERESCENFKLLLTNSTSLSRSEQNKLKLVRNGKFWVGKIWNVVIGELVTDSHTYIIYSYHQNNTQSEDRQLTSNYCVISYLNSIIDVAKDLLFLRVNIYLPRVQENDQKRHVLFAANDKSR